MQDSTIPVYTYDDAKVLEKRDGNEVRNIIELTFSLAYFGGVTYVVTGQPTVLLMANVTHPHSKASEKQAFFFDLTEQDRLQKCTIIRWHHCHH